MPRILIQGKIEAITGKPKIGDSVSIVVDAPRVAMAVGKGDKGDPGDPGEPGEPGEPGPPGEDGAGAGPITLSLIEDMSSVGRLLMADADAAAMRSRLGLGSAAIAASSAFDAAGTSTALAATLGALATSTDAANLTGTVALARMHADVVQTGDARLTDSRAPTAHTQAASTISDSSAAGRALLTAADAAAQRTSLALGSAALLNSSAFDVAGAAADAEAAAADYADTVAANAVVTASDFADSQDTALLASLGPLATSTDAANLTGTVALARMHADVVQTGDARLSDARAPTAHTQAASTISDSSAAGRAVLTAADAPAQRTALGLATVASSGSASDLGTGTLPDARIADGSLVFAKLSGTIADGEFVRRSGTGFASAALAAIAASGSASDLGAGTVPIARIADGDVTLAKLANLAADTMIGRASGTGVPQAIAVTAAGRALLDDAAAADQRTTLGLAAIAASGSASDLGAGTVPIARIPLGSSSSTVAVGNDARLSDARTPTSHGSTHTSTDAIPNATEAAPGLYPANTGIRAVGAPSIANTLTRVVGFTAASGTLRAETRIRFRAGGLLTNTTAASTSVLTLRIASASLGTPIVQSWSCVLGTTARTNCPVVIEGEIRIITTGGSGTALGYLAVFINSTTQLALPTTMISSPVTIATNAVREVELACISGASTTTWNILSATAEVVNP